MGIFVPLFFVLSSIGFVATNAMAGGLSVDPSRAGAVSALFGATQFSLAGLATVAAALLSREPALAMAVVIMICSAGSLVFPLRLLAQRRALLT